MAKCRSCACRSCENSGHVIWRSAGHVNCRSRDVSVMWNLGHAISRSCEKPWWYVYPSGRPSRCSEILLVPVSVECDEETRTLVERQVKGMTLRCSALTEEKKMRATFVVCFVGFCKGACENYPCFLYRVFSAFYLFCLLIGWLLDHSPTKRVQTVKKKNSRSTMRNETQQNKSCWVLNT